MSALAKLVTVLQHDADHGIRHERMDVAPAFYEELLLELGRLRTPQPLASSISRLTIHGPHGPVELRAKQE